MNCQIQRDYQLSAYRRATSRRWGDRASFHCDKMPSAIPKLPADRKSSFRLAFRFVHLGERIKFNAFIQGCPGDAINVGDGFGALDLLVDPGFVGTGFLSGVLSEAFLVLWLGGEIFPT